MRARLRPISGPAGVLLASVVLAAPGPAAAAPQVYDAGVAKAAPEATTGTGSPPVGGRKKPKNSDPVQDVKDAVAKCKAEGTDPTLCDVGGVAAGATIPGSGVGGAPATEKVGSMGQVDPISGLVENPICDAVSGASPEVRSNCRRYGTPDGRYPTGNYGLDVNIDTGLDDIKGTFLSALVSIANMIWLGMLFILKIVLAFLGWAFTLNPFSEGSVLGSVSKGLERFFESFTRPLMVVAFVAIGGWISLGLIRRRGAETVAQAMFSIALMLLAMWVILAPSQTIGRVSKLVDRAALAVIAAPQEGSISHPTGTYANTTNEIWGVFAGTPFDMLNFSDVRWANSKPPAEAVAKSNAKLCTDVAYRQSIGIDRSLRDQVLPFADPDAAGACQRIVDRSFGRPKTIRDLYLRSSPGSEAREELWDYFDGNSDTKPKVAIQGGDGAMMRLPIVLVMAVGLLGGLLLLAWLAIRLFTQSAIAFVLVLATPIAFFFPAFGEAGRNSFRLWGKTLISALLAKLVYSTLLAVVLFATTVLGGLAGPEGGVGNIMGFVLLSGFWWAVFLSRSQLLEIISPSQSADGGGGMLRGVALGQLASQIGIGRRGGRSTRAAFASSGGGRTRGAGGPSGGSGPQRGGASGQNGKGPGGSGGSSPNGSGPESPSARQRRGGEGGESGGQARVGLPKSNGNGSTPATAATPAGATTPRPPRSALRSVAPLTGVKGSARNGGSATRPEAKSPGPESKRAKLAAPGRDPRTRARRPDYARPKRKPPKNPPPRRGVYRG